MPKSKKPKPKSTKHVTATGDAVLEAHPFALCFPLLDDDELKKLIDDIAVNKLREPIVLYQGKILDGRNRYRACLKLKIKPRTVRFKGDDKDAIAFVYSKNVCRRHLTPKKKGEAIDDLIKKMPEKSDRQLAHIIKASPTTIAAHRAKLEKAGDVSRLDTRTDTKGRQQPAAKPAAPKPKPAPAPAPVEPQIEAQVNPPPAAAEQPATAIEVAAPTVQQQVEQVIACVPTPKAADAERVPDPPPTRGSK